MRTVFNAWRQENKIERDLASKVNAVMVNVINLNCQSAFDLIKRYAVERNTRKGKNKGKA